MKSLLLILLALASTSYAQEIYQPKPLSMPHQLQFRMIPGSAISATLTGITQQEVQLASSKFEWFASGSKKLMLSPGLRIYNAMNIMILPLMAPLNTSVMYTQDVQGFVDNIWILSEQEQATIKQQASNSQ